MPGRRVTAATMAPMAVCARCGGELVPAARFCPTCGRPVEPEVGPAPPPATPPFLAGWPPPGWVSADWPLAGLGAVVLLGLLFGVAMLVGAVAAVAAGGSVESLPCGAGVGAHLAFAAFAAQVAARCGHEHGAVLGLSFLPLWWALAAGVATEAAVRFGWSRLVDDRRRRIAWVAKLAVATGVLLGLIAGLVGSGGSGDSGFVTRLNGGEVWVYATVLTWAWGWVALRRRALRLLPRPPATARLRAVTRLARPAGEGVLAFGVMASGLAVVGLLFALVVADGGRARIGLLVGFPVVGLSFGAALADGAMGAALAGIRGYTSLVHFGLPARPESGAAPAWLMAALLVAPAVVAVAVWRHLERSRPAEEQGALVVGAATAAGFAGAAWVAALIGRVAVVAAVGRPQNPFSGYLPQVIGHLGAGALGSVGAVVVARPNPASVLGLALLWGLAGGLGAAAAWAAVHGVRWRVAGPTGESLAGPEPTPPPPPGRPPDEPPSAGPAVWLMPPTGGSAPASGAESPERPEAQEAGAGEPPLEEPPEAGNP